MSKYVDIHSHSGKNDDDVYSIRSLFPEEAELISNFSGVNSTFSIGIHPRFIKCDDVKDKLGIVERYSTDKLVSAIGECGLDRFSRTDMETQEKVFIRQVEISEKARKPLVIHCVRAYPEMISLRKKLKPTQAWIIHGFRNNAIIADSLVKNGFMISFGQALLNSQKVQEAFAQIPIDSIFLETDDDKVLPVREIYHAAAEIRKITIEMLADNLKSSFSNIINRNGKLRKL